MQIPLVEKAKTYLTYPFAWLRNQIRRRSWRSYDPSWLVALAKEQFPDEKWLQESLKNCTQVSGEIPMLHFVDPYRPNKPGSAWQFETNRTLEDSEYGDLILDILKDKRVGGVEFLGVLLGGKLKDTECRVNVIVHDSTDRKKPIKSAVVSVLDKKQKTTWVGTADFTFSDPERLINSVDIIVRAKGYHEKRISQFDTSSRDKVNWVAVLLDPE